MCGVAGIFAFAAQSAPVNAMELERIRDAMQARGPDGANQWIAEDRRIGLAHRRLSIIDLAERAGQPMQTPDGALSITFNGEIYNYRALREELIYDGFVFHTNSDTEVLLHLFRRDGAEMVRRLRGMFAFAIWDATAERLFLARDPYGIKPLYYAMDAGVFRFASQARALIAGGAIPETPDPAGWVGFFLHGSVPEPFTTYLAIQALPAGSTLIVNAAGMQDPKSYFSIASVYEAAEHAPGAEERGEELHEALIDSVRHHLVADVPIGCFLSAGIDSCALLTLMRQATDAQISAVTLSFQEFVGSSHDEAPLAALVAKACGVDHRVRVVSRAEFYADLTEIIAAMDQPSIDGLNSYFISKAAREFGLKLAVSGLGGDELFGGYPSFTDIPNWVATCAPFSHWPGLGTAARIAISAAQQVRSFGSPKLAGMLEFGSTFAGAYLLRRGLFMPWELEGFLDHSFLHDGMARLSPVAKINETLDPDPGSDFGRVAALETQLYMRNQLLRDADWASMAHSVEVRVPLVDHILLRKVAGMRPRPRKSDLARATLPPLPSEITNRAKTGFSTPIGSWLDEAGWNAGGTGDVARLVGGQTSRRWASTLVRLWPRANAPLSKALLG